MCRPAAVVHGNVSALVHSFRPLKRALVLRPSSRFPFSHPQKQGAPRSFGYWSEAKRHREGRVQPVSAPLVDARSPLCFAINSSLLTARFPLCKPRPCRSFDRGAVCLRAQPSRQCIAALPLLPTWYKRGANRRCLCLTPHVRPNSTTTPRPCGHT